MLHVKIPTASKKSERVDLDYKTFALTKLLRKNATYPQVYRACFLGSFVFFFLILFIDYVYS